MNSYFPTLPLFYFAQNGNKFKVSSILYTIVVEAGFDYQVFTKPPRTITIIISTLLFG